MHQRLKLQSAKIPVSKLAIKSSTEFRPENKNSIRGITKNLKRIFESIDLYQKKQITSKNTIQDLRNFEIYSQILNEKLQKKDFKSEKLNKKIIENKKEELGNLSGQLEGLTKELNMKRATVEHLKSFSGKMIRELKKHIKGFLENEKIDLGKTLVKVSSFNELEPRISKSRSKSKIILPSDVLLTLKPTQSKFAQQYKNPIKNKEIAKIWSDKRRSSLVPNKSRIFAQFDAKTMKKFEQLDKQNKDRSFESSDSTSVGGRGRRSTVRYLVNEHHLFNQSNGILTKDNIRGSLMGEGAKIGTLKEFGKPRKSNVIKSAAEICDLMNAKPANKICEKMEEESANSNIGDSIVEEARDELRTKLMKENNSEFKEGEEPNFKIILPSFQPIKVSFKIGVPENKSLTSKNLVVLKDRVYKNFHMCEIEWHFKNKSLCGMRVIWKNILTGFLLGGHFNGKIGDFIDLCKFDVDERIVKIEFGHDATSIRFIEFGTTQGRTFLVGMDRKEAINLGTTFVNRYFPQEIKLYKFFCQFNKITQNIDYFRFLFIRTVLF